LVVPVENRGGSNGATSSGGEAGYASGGGRSGGGDETSSTTDAHAWNYVASMATPRHALAVVVMPDTSEKDAKLACKLGQLQPFIAVFPRNACRANL
jgi:hypothetical protein